MGPEKDPKMRASYTIKEKVSWIEEAAKSGVTQVQVAAKFGIKLSTRTPTEF